MNDSKTEFEKWVPLYWDITKMTDDEGDEVYQCDLTQGAFIGWQAATEQQQSVIDELRTKLAEAQAALAAKDEYVKNKLIVVGKAMGLSASNGTTTYAYFKSDEVKVGDKVYAIKE